MKTIDLRSDTVTRPSPGMLQAMVKAEVGDDVYGDDPTVNLLQERVADLLGFEAALFAASGTQTNLIALLSHCERGDEYIVGQTAHTYRYEAGGGAVLGSIQPQPIEFEEDSTLDLAKVAAKIKPDDIHFARTRLLCLENTQHGKALPLQYLKDAAAFAREKGLRLHLDGARICNAAVHHDLPPAELCLGFDSVSLCLSKGLGTPVGSVLAGSKEFIGRALRWRKMVGGGMRQAGILAAAGLYALEHNITRLAQDHANARRLTAGLAEFGQLRVATDTSQTNMAFFSMDAELVQPLTAFLAEKNILISGAPTTRLVTHLDIDEKDVTFFLEQVAAFFAGRK